MGNTASQVAPGRIFRELDELWNPLGEADRVVRVSTARVAWMDHARLAHDLPALGRPEVVGTGAEADDCRERWLLKHAGVISVSQAGQDAVNTPIAAQGDPVPAWRPPLYGRAVVVRGAVAGPAGAAGSLLLDVKGAGLGPGRAFSRDHHASGLCQLREALREALFEAAIGGILRRAGTGLHTLPVYGVLDLGFDVITHRGEHIPAGVLVRRAHRRDVDDLVLPRLGSPEERVSVEVELLLRQHGITSSNPGTTYHLREREDGLRVVFGFEPLRDAPREAADAIRASVGDGELPAECDALNVQLVRPEGDPAPRGQLVDFGHYEVRRAFHRPLVSTVCDRPLRWGRMIGPQSPWFVQPDPRLCARLDAWVQEEEDSPVPRLMRDPPMRWAHQAALAARAGRLNAAAIADVLRRAGDSVEPLTPP